VLHIIKGANARRIGTGEQIMKTMFTFKCTERLKKEDDVQTAINGALMNDFLGNLYISIQNKSMESKHL
jgi:taspase (threonine aspartase 1)